MSYYLSRIELDRHKKSTRCALANPDLFHGAIEKAFNCTNERKLWRVDTVRGKRYLLIVSRSKADLSSLTEQFSPPQSKGLTKSYDNFLSSIENGGVWDFRLSAAPIINKSAKEFGKRGKQQPICKQKDQIKWLNRKATQNGFCVFPETLIITNPGTIYFKKGEDDASCTIAMLNVMFRGKLEVTDPVLFKNALVNGIGKYKAFGAGMLTAIPLQR